MSSSFEVRARQAAGAARASVARPSAELIDRHLASPGWDSPPHGRRPSVLTAVAVAGVVIGVAFVALGRAPDSTRVTTAPAAPAVPAAEPRPGLRPPAPGPGGVQLATGTASDGRPWTLWLGGPFREACFTMALDERLSSGGCAGRVDGLPLGPDERYVPDIFDDSRMPAFLWGRVAPGVRDVEVEVSGGRALDQQPVVADTGEGDGAYAVELPPGSDPRAVVGHRDDGTTVRYAVPRRQGPRPIRPFGWNPAVVNGVLAGLVALGVLFVTLTVRARRRSRRAGSSGGARGNR